MFFQASTDSSAKLALFLIVGGIVSIAKGYRAFANRRKVQDTPCSKIASAPQGLVEVQGQAWPTAQLQCLDGRPVCYWGLAVEELRRHGKGTQWVVVFTFTSSDDILVTDASASCRVIPSEAQFEVEKLVIPASKLTDENRRVLGLRAPFALRHLSPGVLGGLFSPKVRLTETKILAGAPIYVRGEFSTSVDQTYAVAVGDHTGFRMQMTKLSSAGYQANLFDRNRDGKISEEEMTSGCAAAASRFLRNAESQSVAVTGFFQAEPTHGLLIADAHQSHLLARLGFHTLLYLWGGLVSFSLGVFILLKNM